MIIMVNYHTMKSVGKLKKRNPDRDSKWFHYIMKTEEPNNTGTGSVFDKIKMEGTHYGPY